MRRAYARAEKQDKRLDSIEQEIGKLSTRFGESMEQVQTMLREVLRMQDSMGL